MDLDIEEWKKGAHKEITQLESKETWVEVPTSEATSKILPGTWVFCHKRASTGIIVKFKARYMDDCGIASHGMSEIDAFIDRLKSKGFLLTKECDFSTYLGIKFQRNPQNNTITMTQPGLIKKVIEATRMELCRANNTPTSQTTLGSDPEGSPVKETWKYSSVVGMLPYLSMNTRPDIAYAVSQVAWFNSNPKESHASAVKMIIRYLLVMSDKGIIFTSTTDFKVDWIAWQRTS